MIKKNDYNVSDWDWAEVLDTDEHIKDFLNTVLSKNDNSLFIKALGDIARAKGMTKIANQTGLSREHLYKALSVNGSPSYKLIKKILDVLNLDITVSENQKEKAFT
jgi:probable addiction module antidote protein